jgi:hypothetical protein
MNRFRSALIGLISAFAVLVVSVTCTQAGCLLSVATAKASVPSAMPCCREHSSAPGDSQKDSHDRSKRCPTCDQTLTNDGAMQKAPAISASHIAPLFMVPLIDSLGPSAPGVCHPISTPGAAPPVSPPTLINLHCALLT